MDRDFGALRSRDRGTHVSALLDRAEAGGANNPDATPAAFWKGVADKAIFGDVKRRRVCGRLSAFR